MWATSVTNYVPLNNLVTLLNSKCDIKLVYLSLRMCIHS